MNKYMDNDENLLSVIDHNGIPTKIFVLKYFTIKSVNKDFIIYKKLNHNLVFSAEVVDNGDSIELKEITDKEIIKKIEIYLKGLVK